MFIIVEGVDGVGKTTLVSMLERHLRDVAGGDKVEVLRKGPPARPSLEEYELDVQDYRPGDRRHIICDRWHLGELIYGPLLRGASSLDPVEQLHVEKFLLSRGAICVLLTAPPDVIRERREARDAPDLLRDDQVEDVMHRYWVEMWQSGIPAYEVNWGRGFEDKHDTVAMIAYEARKFEIEHATLAGFPTYVGRCHPRVLLLGERRNPNGDPRWQQAFTPTPATAARYLLQNLPPDIAASCGLANALEENVPALYATLGEPQVVALGREAKKVCEREGIDHGAVPHPQYVRRFHHSHGEEYGRVIRRAARLEEDLIQWRP